MSTEVKLPELGENISAGDLLKLLVKPGDKIRKDQALLELETDKAAIEVPSPIDGTVKQVHVKEGQKVKVGQLILSVDENGSGVAKKEADKGAGRESANGGISQGAAPPKVEQPARAQAPKQVEAQPKVESKKAAPKASAAGTVLEFKLPELGENITSGDLLQLLVKPGDTVTTNQPVLELETDKATIEVPSTIEGTVKSVLVKEGDKLKVGQTIFTVEGQVTEPQVAEAAAETGEGGIATGGQIPQEQPIGATTKETIEQTPAPQPIPRIEAVIPDWENEQAVPPAPDVPPQVSRRTGKLPSDVAAAPSVRALAREIGVDITEVKGTGPHGRMTVADVKAFARHRAQELEKVGGHAVALAPLPDFARWGSIERKPMTGIRRKTAEHMQQAWAIPHVTNNDRADITELEELRKTFSKRAEAAGGKLTMTAIALKIVSSALKQFPQFAASIDLAKEEVVYKSYMNVGVAVDTERGLLVPVIRDVDRKNIIEISVELQQIAQRSRDRKLKPEEMEGGVFTITNLGGIGGTSFTPIINSPEVAILGMMRSSIEPVYIGGKFEPRLMLPLSLSYDHRLIDGADAARFLRWLCEAFEQPFLLSLQG